MKSFYKINKPLRDLISKNYPRYNNDIRLFDYFCYQYCDYYITQIIRDYDEYDDDYWEETSIVTKIEKIHILSNYCKLQKLSQRLIY